MLKGMQRVKKARGQWLLGLLAFAVLPFAVACQDLQWLQDLRRGKKPEARPKPSEPARAAERQQQPEKAEAPPPPMLEPVPLWENGKTEKQVDAVTADAHGYVVLDLGEAWTPYIFTDGVSEEGEPLVHLYRPTYLALARGEFPDDRHGERARDDKYLELYGILPTLSLLRERFRVTSSLTCTEELDLKPLVDFDGFVAYRTKEIAIKEAADARYLAAKVKEMMRRQRVASPQELDVSKLPARDVERLKRFEKVAPKYYAIRATQERLKCEGYFKGLGRFVRGGLDWVTHEALAQFERRHRVYGWGYLGIETRRMLRMTPMEAEREGVLRVLTERAMHAAAVIEDGSTSTKKNGEPVTFLGADGNQHPIPNLEEGLRQSAIQAFGLQTPQSTLAWLESLGELPKDGHLLVAISRPELPEYYDGDMELTLEYYRGDVWYDFPYDDQGQERFQPVTRRPRVTLFTKYNGRRIPLARFGTTIGGWRSEKIGDHVMWKYKESPVGWRVWKRIVSAPVWLPPDGTPPRDMLKRRKKRRPGEPRYAINYDETGPSYASAYGLVAAYHQKYLRRADGTILVGGDEGIRTHGSVDYMSIMRRHSHGCHRLHNHLAMRLMCFVLAHRPHIRQGHQPLAFKKTFEYEEETYEMELNVGGYVFELLTPLEVNVLEGRVRGKVKEPIAVAVPKFNEDAGAYIMPDAGPVQVRGGELVPAPPPTPDGGVGLDDPMGRTTPITIFPGEAPQVQRPGRPSTQ